MSDILCLTPYRELRHGDQSLFQNLGTPRPLSPGVRQYLLLGTRQSFVQGIYRHPFTDRELIGPVLLGDGERFTWDRDTVEYAERYGLKLPQAFLDFVDSPEGFLALCRMRRMA